MGPNAEAPHDWTGIGGGAALAGRAVRAMPPTTPSELAATSARRKIRFIAVPVSEFLRE
jgi:hypothetical protein